MSNPGNPRQGTLAWHADRCGKLTASRVAVVLDGTPAARARLMDTLELEAELGPEWVMANAPKAPPLDWGHTHEPAALAHYELIHDVDVERVGFAVHPELPWLGASLDGLLPGRTVEVKCPWSPDVHAATVLHGMPAAHRHQVQCQLAVFPDRAGCEFLSYDPRYPDPARRLVECPQARDPAYIERLLEACVAFWAQFQRGERPAGLRADDPIPKLF